jgi:hypothetical protein
VQQTFNQYSSLAEGLIAQTALFMDMQRHEVSVKTCNTAASKALEWLNDQFGERNGSKVNSLKCKKELKVMFD